MSFMLQNFSISSHNNEPLFDSLHMKIENGEVLCLMGPSGCGKSTLLDAIAGHLNQNFSFQGEIILNDKSIENLPAYQRQIGILFQDDLLFPHLKVWENLAFALPNEFKGSERKNKALEALENINLLNLANSYPDQISGGQRSRISLIRMLLAKPKLILLDEPFNKLDKELRKQFRDWVISEIRKANVPMLMVTHDLEDAPKNSRLLTWPWHSQEVMN